MRKSLLLSNSLQKGKLSFGVHYLINQGALKAENGVYVDQLTLGAKNNSPDATSLPVKLAIALLKDRSGRIKLDIPVQGRLDDPKFSVGPIIWQVVVNLIAKAATSPFSLLGAAFGGGEEMSFVAFEPGCTPVPESGSQKLDTPAKALYERPELNLEISGSVDPETDRAPLARAKLEDQIKLRWIKEQNDAGKPAPPMDQIKLEPEEYERLVRKAREEAFGSPQPSAPTTNSPPPPLAAPPVAPTSVVTVYRPRCRAESYPPVHGAALLMGPWTPRRTDAEPSQPPAAPAAPALTPVPTPAPAPVAEPALADLEAKLLQAIQVTDDDLRDLMRQRAQAVQAWLLKTEKVTAERLFILAPKSIDGSAKGEARVNLSLN